MTTLKPIPISHRFSFAFLRVDLRTYRFKALVVLFVLCGNQNLVLAETYPNKPIRIVVPYPPGGFNDTLARTLGQKLSEKWKQPVVVDNRPGGGTTVATGMVARSPADGYTLLMASFAYTVNPALYASLPYDTERAFQPIILAAVAPNIIAVNPSRPYKTIKELITQAKSKPGSINYASGGNGTSNHLCMELFKSKTGVDMVHVPYKGSAPAVTDLLGGQVDIICDNAPNVLPHIRAGKLRGLAVTAERRTAVTPEILTVAESGVPGFDVLVWFGLIAPAGTPKTVVEALNNEINRILVLAEVRRLFDAQGVEPRGGSTLAFANLLSTQSSVWMKLIKESGIKAE
ncbi:MAG: tripartite tricarboxylate transporter substrate binding protein [Burkholderiales bacterium]